MDEERNTGGLTVSELQERFPLISAETGMPVSPYRTRGTTERKQLYAAFVKAQGEMDNAALNKVNPHFKSKYADLGAIRAATLPALNKHGLGLMQWPQHDGQGGLILITRLVHESGEWMEADYPVSPVDKPQQMGSSLTYARRYMWAAICGITAEEDDDANAAQGAKKAREPQENPADFIARKLDECEDLASLEAVWKGQQPAIKRLAPQAQATLEALKDKLKVGLMPEREPGDESENPLAGG